MIVDVSIQWYLLIGVLLLSVSVLEPALKHKWVASVHLQLLGGIVAGPKLLGLMNVEMVAHAAALEVISEVAVIVSLYAAGIKMRIPLRSSRWHAPILLATLTMLVTIGLVTFIGYYYLRLPFALALLLGAVLAPTDPVLADNIQVHHPNDSDRLRQSVTGEAGLNDGTAFPFVLLAIGLSNPEAHELGYGLWRWFLLDLLWKVSGGLLLGATAGRLLGQCLLRYRDPTAAAATNQELLTLGVIAITYGVALACDTYAFLAVFAAAVSLRRIEMHTSDAPAMNDGNAGSDSQVVKLIEDQTEVGSALEQIVKVFLVFIVGVMVSQIDFMDQRLWLFGGLMIFLVRPLSVWCTLRLKAVSPVQRSLIAWFGIRGIGTLYYLGYAIEEQVADRPSPEIKLVADCCVFTILMSIVFHGTTDTPLLKWYRNHR